MIVGKVLVLVELICCVSCFALNGNRFEYDDEQNSIRGGSI